MEMPSFAKSMLIKEVAAIIKGQCPRVAEDLDTLMGYVLGHKQGKRSLLPITMIHPVKDNTKTRTTVDLVITQDSLGLRLRVVCVGDRVYLIRFFVSSHESSGSAYDEIKVDRDPTDELKPTLGKAVDFTMRRKWKAAVAVATAPATAAAAAAVATVNNKTRGRPRPASSSRSPRRVP